MVANDPTQSLKTISENLGISKQSVWRILKHLKYKPFKMSIVQELGEGDEDRRLEFCETILEKINANADLIKHIVFSDESSFSLSGEVNTQNCRYWSDSNPHVLRHGHTQWPQKINVWAGIFGDHVIGPIFFEGNLTGEKYLAMLQNVIQPLVVRAIEDNDNHTELDEENIFFQQDGAPAHYTIPVREYLDREYPGKWIGRRGPIEWPPRSPDLTPIDFFLWGHLKTVVYKTPNDNIEMLKTRIFDECHKLTPANFKNIRQEFQDRLYYCQEVNGMQFEHLI